MARRWRLHHPDLAGGAGTVVVLQAAEAHHARRVLRLEAGEAVAVFDGRGAEWTGRLVRCDAGAVEVRLEEERVDRGVDPTLPVVLFQALCRPDRMEWVLRKGTEVGLSAVHPWPSERAETVRVTAARRRRWERIALEACKQSGRRRAPRIEPRDDLPEPTAGVLALVLDTAPDAPLLRTWLDGDRPGEVWLAAGPEAGLTPGELARWTELGWGRAGLGPRTLRAESAGLVAAAIALHRWDDLG